MRIFFFTSDSSYSNDVHIDLLKQIISHIFSAWSSFIFRDFNHLDLDFSRDLETFWNFWLHPREQKWGLYQGRFQMRCQKRLKSHVFIIIILSLDNGAGTYYCLNMVVSQWPHGPNEMELTAQSHQSKIFRHFSSFWPNLVYFHFALYSKRLMNSAINKQMCVWKEFRRNIQSSTYWL